MLGFKRILSGMGYHIALWSFVGCLFSGLFNYQPEAEANSVTPSSQQTSQWRNDDLRHGREVTHHHKTETKRSTS